MRILISIPGAPFYSNLLWGKKQEAGEVKKETNSIFLNKLCSQGGHFPSSTNPSPYSGHFHPWCPAPWISAILHCVVCTHCFVSVREAVGRLLLQVLPSFSCRQGTWNNPDTGPIYITPGVRISKLPHSKFAIIMWNTRTFKSCLTYSLLPPMIPWKSYVHFVKDPYSSFGGENVEGSWLRNLTRLDSTPRTTSCMTLENKFFKLAETCLFIFSLIKQKAIIS